MSVRIVRADGSHRVGPADLDFYYAGDPERARVALDAAEPDGAPHRVETFPVPSRPSS